MLLEVRYMYIGFSHNIWMMLFHPYNIYLFKIMCSYMHNDTMRKVEYIMVTMQMNLFIMHPHYIT
jgi:hypothetical protein